MSFFPSDYWLWIDYKLSSRDKNKSPLHTTILKNGCWSDIIIFLNNNFPRWKRSRVGSTGNILYQPAWIEHEWITICASLFQKDQRLKVLKLCIILKSMQLLYLLYINDLERKPWPWQTRFKGNLLPKITWITKSVWFLFQSHLRSVQILALELECLAARGSSCSNENPWLL